jgi:hypothetical protein
VAASARRAAANDHEPLVLRDKDPGTVFIRLSIYQRQFFDKDRKYQITNVFHMIIIKYYTS